MKNILKTATLICLVATMLMLVSCDSALFQLQPKNDPPEQTTTPHVHNKRFITSMDPTCTETGLIGGEECADCGEILEAPTVIPATGHALVFVPAKDFTCKEWGYSEHWTCSTCGEGLSENGEEMEIELYAPNHDFVNNACTKCNSILTPDGFVFRLNDDGQSYCLDSFVVDEVKTEIVIPDAFNGLPVTAIDSAVFGNCQHLTSVTLPNTVTSIGEIAFIRCANITNIVLPNGVQSIGDGAFTMCGLESITVPNSVTSIGICAFMSCENLGSITFEGTIEQWNAIEKGIDWDHGTGNYTIHCTDGDITK